VNAPGEVGRGLLTRAARESGSERMRTVRVGFASVEAWEPRIDLFAQTLDDRERARIARMRFERDRTVLTVAYGLHRRMLADELGIPPERVPLYRDADGRPRIVGDTVWTSLSHAANWVAVAIDRAAPVGVDVEPFLRAAAVAEVAEAVLHPDEREAAGVEGAGGGLLAVWVRKEAVLKAVGVGLRVPMDAFPALQLDSVRVPGFEGRWHVRDLSVDAPVHAAVATRGRVHVACFVMRPSRNPNATIAFASRS
jgi:4'-phosphopantetheinyl transferase